MMRDGSIQSLSYFRLSPDFDYRKYLETRSHFTDLSDFLSDEIRPLAYSQESLAVSVRELSEHAGRSGAQLSEITDLLGGSNEVLRELAAGHLDLPPFLV